jgi:hypothetical protein
MSSPRFALSLAAAVLLVSCDMPVAEQWGPLSVVVNEANADAGTDQGEEASAVPAPPVAPTVAGDGDSDYATMCRHYCDALHDTDLYYCLGTGDTPASCATKFDGASDLCVQLRCGPPQRVQASLCLTQCDALAGTYGVVCATGGGHAGDPALCPLSVAEHDRACRAGCTPVN